MIRVLFGLLCTVQRKTSTLHHYYYIVCAITVHHCMQGLRCFIPTLHQHDWVSSAEYQVWFSSVDCYLQISARGDSSGVLEITHASTLRGTVTEFRTVSIHRMRRSVVSPMCSFITLWVYNEVFCSECIELNQQISMQILQFERFKVSSWSLMCQRSSGFKTSLTCLL